MRSWLPVILVTLGTAPPPGSPDLDVRISSGTPMEWNRELSRPVPTGHRGRVPVATGGGARPEDKSRPGTQVEEGLPKGPVQVPVRPTLEYTVLNGFDFFLGTSADGPSHLKWGTPPKVKPQVTQDDVATEGGFLLKWNYPPVFPAELIWVGIMATLRERVHPKAVSWVEAAAYCVEVGEPAVLGTTIGDGRIAAYLTGMDSKLAPKPPDVPKPADPALAGLYYLAAVELSGGFPQALDPAFARRTLALGDEMYDAVLECCRSSHPFLARNAVVVLGGFPKATPDLVKLWKESKDRTFRLRALRALAERRESSIMKDVTDEFSLTDLPMTCAAIHFLGMIGDPSAQNAVIGVLLKNKKGATAADNVDWTRTELLLSAIPALGRMKGGKDLLLSMEPYLRAKCKGRDETSREDPDLDPLLRQDCLIALAHHGEKAYVDEVVRRVKQKGLDAFHPSTHYLLIDALTATAEGAEASKLKVPIDRHVRLALVESLSKTQRITPEELEKIALRAAEDPAVRARAIQLLLDHDGPTLQAVCRKILAEFAKGTGPVEPGLGLVVSAAARVGGMVGAAGASVLVDAVKRALQHACFARREGNNETNLAETRIAMFPALLETLAIELGRTGDPGSLPTLRRLISQKQFPQGRAEAVTAVGAIPGKEADQILVEALADKDGWVRFCAYRALVKRSKEDHFSGWIWMDNPAAARKAIAAYKDWLKKKYP